MSDSTQKTYDNVFIFGAGVSFDAGIPLLSNFVETMMNMAFTGHTPAGDKLPDDKRQILKEAVDLREKLAAFQSRSNFDLWNIEDILNILAFHQLAEPKAKKWYDQFVDAIRVTIEETSQVPIKGKLVDPLSRYTEFWQSASEAQVKPAIISFNYDLVMERALVHLYSSATGRVRNFYNSITLDYGIVSDTPQAWQVESPTMAMGSGHATIPFLKLHGSLNWQKEPAELSLHAIAQHKPATATAPNPFIMAPAYDKGARLPQMEQVWQRAYKALAQAKNIVVVGYSLPRTDIYMQYFLKAAIGGNQDLMKITVFDPILHTDTPGNEALRNRYRACFSSHFQRRVDFDFDFTDCTGYPDAGTWQHFTNTIHHYPDKLLFR